MAEFSNWAVKLGGRDPRGEYQARDEKYDIPDQVYVAGQTTLPLRLFGARSSFTFVGYEARTFYPVFFTSAGGGTHVIATDEPPGQGKYAPGEIVTGTPYTPCFAPGTLIATPDGERAVEALKPGEEVRTADGGAATVRWVGFQKIPTMFGPKEVTCPVRIRAGALGDKVPHTDLVVTKDHGMILDGVICHAGALVNGKGVVEVPAAELGGVAMYYHVETEAHVQLLANGAAAESFIDQADRARFANYGEFVEMHGLDVPVMAEMHLPRAMSARQVPQRIKSRLAQRAVVIMAPAAKKGA